LNWSLCINGSFPAQGNSPVFRRRGPVDILLRQPKARYRLGHQELNAKLRDFAHVYIDSRPLLAMMLDQMLGLDEGENASGRQLDEHAEGFASSLEKASTSSPFLCAISKTRRQNRAIGMPTSGNT
jgi:hypothetical protein